MNSAAQYTGQTRITGGTLLLGPGGSQSKSYLVNVASGATLDLGNQSRMLQALVGSGAVNLGTGTLTVADPGSANATIFSGAFSGAGGVVRSGPGSLTLSGNSTFTGGLTASGGATVYLAGASSFKGGITVSTGSTVNASSDAYLGDPSNGVAIAGGTLQTTASFSTARPINVASSGGTINVSAAATLIDSGLLSGPGATSLTGGGTLRLSHANTLSGPVSITGGTLALSAGGSLLSVPSLTLSAGSTLLLDDSTVSGGNLAGGRLGSGTAVSFSSGGGRVQMLGAANTPSSESVGKLTTGPGQTIISVTDGANSTANLAFAGLVHRIGSQVIFETGDGTTLGGTDRVMLGSYTPGLMPAWARLEVGSSLVSAAYDPTLGVIPASQYIPPSGEAVGSSISAVPEPSAATVLAFVSAGLLTRRRSRWYTTRIRRS